MGRLPEALAEITRANELAPDSEIIATDVGQILYMDQQYSGAIDQYQKVLEKDPSFAMAHLRLGEAYAQVDRFKEAFEEMRKAEALDINTDAWLASLYAVSGQRKLAKNTIHEVEEEVRKGEVHDRTGIAWTYAALGDRDAAFMWLEEGYRRHDGGMALLLVDPRFQGLHADPRFDELLRRMNLN